MDFDAKALDEIWNKGIPKKGYDSNLIRQDACGAWILKEAFAKTDNDFAWDIDYILPKSLGGDERMENLRPMNRMNVVSKGNDYPEYYSALQANGSNNIESRTLHIVNEKMQEILKSLYKI